MLGGIGACSGALYRRGVAVISVRYAGRAGMGGVCPPNSGQESWNEHHPHNADGVAGKPWVAAREMASLSAMILRSVATNSSSAGS